MMSSDSVHSVVPTAGRPTSQIRCGASPCPNFTTRPSSSEPWIAHGCCSRHTLCDRRHTCTVCDSWSEETWIGFDAWMKQRIKPSERDAANRVRKAKAPRERSRSPRSSEPSGQPSDHGRARTPRTATTTPIAGSPATAGSPASAGGTAIAITLPFMHLRAVR